MTKPGIVDINRQLIISKVGQGVPVGKIAQELNIDRRTIARHLAHDPEYIQAIQDYHDSRLDEAEAMLEDAATHPDVPSRGYRAQSASAYWRSVSWRAERLDKRYGNKQELNVTSYNVDIRGILADRESRLKEMTRETIVNDIVNDDEHG